MGLFEKKYHGWSWFTPLKCSYVRWSLNCKLLDYWLRIFLKYGFITFYLKVGTPIHPMDDGIICPATWHHIVASHDIRIPISPGSYPEMFRMFRFLSNVSYYIHSIHIYILYYIIIILISASYTIHHQIGEILYLRIYLLDGSPKIHRTQDILPLLSTVIRRFLPKAPIKQKARLLKAADSTGCHESTERGFREFEFLNVWRKLFMFSLFCETEVDLELWNHISLDVNGEIE